MENNVPKQILNLRNNVLLFRKFQLSIMKQLLLLLVLALYCVTTHAQTARTTAPRVMEVGAYLTSLRTSESTSRSSAFSADRVGHLLKDVQPAVYFYSGEVKTYGDHPNSLFTNSASLNNIDASSIEKQHIEMVTITIKATSDLSAIDLSVFSNFPNLKYIYILSTIETTESIISNLIRNNDSRYGIFYKIEKGA